MKIILYSYIYRIYDKHGKLYQYLIFSRSKRAYFKFIYFLTFGHEFYYYTSILNVHNVTRKIKRTNYYIINIRYESIIIRYNVFRLNYSILNRPKPSRCSQTLQEFTYIFTVSSKSHFINYYLLHILFDDVLSGIE